MRRPQNKGDKPLGNPVSEASGGLGSGEWVVGAGTGAGLPSPVGFVVHHRAGPRVLRPHGASPDG